MRWLLFLAAILASVTLVGQSTLKIYVVVDDSRSDMIIIDLNTSAIDQYGQSVDSTNMNYYTTTMSTQVVRLSYEELYGAPKEEPVALLEEVIVDPLLDEPTASTTEALIEESSQSTPEAVIVKQSNEVSSPPSPPYSASKKQISYKSRDTKTKSKLKRRRLKRIPKSKRYRGQCPKFS